MSFCFGHYVPWVPGRLCTVADPECSSPGSVAVVVAEPSEPVAKRRKVGVEVAAEVADESGVVSSFDVALHEFDVALREFGEDYFEEFVMRQIKEAESLELPVWEALANIFAPSLADLKENLQKCRDAMPFLKTEGINYNGFQRRSAVCSK